MTCQPHKLAAVQALRALPVGHPVGRTRRGDDPPRLRHGPGPALEDERAKLVKKDRAIERFLGLDHFMGSQAVQSFRWGATPETAVNTVVTIGGVAGAFRARLQLNVEAVAST